MSMSQEDNPLITTFKCILYNYNYEIEIAISEKPSFNCQLSIRYPICVIQFPSLWTLY